VAGVSRDHARIDFHGERGGGRWSDEADFAATGSDPAGGYVAPSARITDLGSRNGTRVNREPISGSTLLLDGDVIHLGDAKLEVYYQEDRAALDESDETGALAGDLGGLLFCERCERSFGEGSIVFGGAISYGSYYVCEDCDGELSGEKVIAGYRVVSKLGAGAFANVYKALAPDASTMVALKVISFNAVPDPRALAMFKREFQLLLSLNHPNIVRVLAAGACEDGYCVAMQLVGGGELKDLIKRRERLSPLQTAQAANAILSALSYAHGKGIIHRDIKPSNVLVNPSGQLWLADFGLARCLDDSMLTQLTASNTAMGTPRFMPPEQFVDAHSADHRSDLYSVGATMYHALLGKPPFHAARSIAAIALKTQHEDPPRLDGLVPGVSRELADVVARALARKPADRFQSADAMREALGAVALS
jgi:serine/threonine-protein kinase